MTPGPTIRRVHVEFLRPGPAHNQLLSPFTQYLAICNDAGAAVVGVPYEQRAFERRQKALRYETGDHRDRLDMLHEIGGELGRVLEAVPGFPGALMHDPGAPNTLVHLRLTLSAAELAQLPFELAEVPAGASAALAIQTRPPVAVTRHIRTVSCEGMTWPDRPRVLFVSADPAAVPFAEHRAALLDAIQPFQYPGTDDAARDGRREQFGGLLTILVDPTLADLEAECEAHAYTHVHVLTHGDRDPVAGDAYGIVFRHEQGEADVVSGERFVSAITRVGHRPAVVTVASCDSGNLGSVAVPGASFAHAIHQAGVPFVLGAQFPLSKPGSVPLAARVYRGLLWGRHPLLVLHEARADLHARYNADWHDWASLVAYEALPAQLEPQLEDLQYRQARGAANAALERIDLAVAAAGGPEGGALSSLQAAVEAALARMPAAGPYAIECLGVRASARKRLAQAAFAFARGEVSFADPFDLLDKARQEYARAVRALLTNDPPVLQRKATLHWVLVQLVSLQAVLELDAGPHEWAAAALAASHCLHHGAREEGAWAHASLAELWLLRLADPALDAAGAAEAAARAAEEARALDGLYPGVDEFPVKSTRRQFERYLTWWGSEAFDAGLAQRQRPRRKAWRDPGGLVEVAAHVVEILQRPGAAGPAGPPRPPASGPADGTGAWGGLPGPSVPAPDSAQPPAALQPPRGGDDARPSTAPVTTGRAAPFFVVEALPAGHGDCLWIEYGAGGRTHRLLVDCGTPQTGAALLARAEAVPADERFLELFVMTHIDADHIGGALPFFRAVKRGLRFGDVWFNGWRHVSGQLGARQGEMFSTALVDFDLPWNTWRDGGAVLLEDGEPLEHVLPGGMTLTLLSPTRVELDRLRPVWTRELRRHGLEQGARLDYSRFLRGTPTTRADVAALQDVDALADAPFTPDTAAPNGTSIALLAEYGGAAALFAADAHAPVLAAAIERLLQKRQAPRLRLDLFKVSHHGSRNNVSAELIRLLDCPRYLISTNGDHFFHPDRQAMARVLKYGGPEKTIVFNYLTELTEVWGDPALADVRWRYGCETRYPPPDRPGAVVDLL